MNVYYLANIGAVEMIVFVQNQQDATITVTLYSKGENSQDVFEKEKGLALDASQVELLHQVYVVSVPCYRETGPWGENVYCIQGSHRHPLNDGDSFLSWCYHFRSAIQKGLKSYSCTGSASVATSKDIFDKVFGQFNCRTSYQNMGYSIFQFSPPKDEITSWERSFISGFTKKETVTRKLVDAYVTPERVASVELGQGLRLTLTRNNTSIKLGQGRRLPLKRKLKMLSKSQPNNPALKHVEILKEPVNGKFPVFRHSCTFEEIQQLESIVGRFCKKGYRSIRQKIDTDLPETPENPKFVISYRPSKFKLGVKFTHLSD